ncbi:MAG: imidazole glycerol phosphate synthase subunit HisH [Archaeoglobales archaeon]|nr:imidazole glycerol phosphate synthase subunit HisH [Archaeoglobales archaeon]
MLVILNYGVGNLKSILNAIRYVGGKAIVSEDLKNIKEAEGIILPGVGAFKPAIERLKSMNFSLDDLNVPVLGICLGMQLLASESYEGGRHLGLNLLPGKVVRFPQKVGKIPHMGWNRVHFLRDHELFDGIENGCYFYFVHSYFLQTSEDFVLSLTDYGIKFASSVARDNVLGTQFHPEKSGKAGLKVLENFIGFCKK